MRVKTEQYQDMIARLFPIKEAERAKKSLARTVTFQVTDACNLACTYCYQINKSTHSMSFDVAKRYIDMLLVADEKSSEYINPKNSPAVIMEFIGGEPLLEIELIDQITNYFISEMIRLRHPWATRFMVSICSNGVLYFDPKVQAYLKKHMSHLSFSISIDGNKELHDACRVFPNGGGSYDIAIAGVKHFTEVLGGKMGSKMTLAPQNVPYLYEAVVNLIGLGYKEILLNCVYEKGWVIEHAKIMYEQLKRVADYLIDNDLFNEIYLSIFEENYFRPKSETENDNWCGGTGAMISTDYKGDIYPCIRYMESSLGADIPPIIIGNVYEGLLATEEQSKCVDCLKAVTRRSQSSDECFNCPIAEGCAWCSAYHYQEFGTVDKRATYICVMHKARALANVYFWNKGYRKYNEPKIFRNYVPDDWSLEIIDEHELQTLKELEGRDRIGEQDG